MKNLKENYKNLAKKYNLPPWEEMDEEFELLYMREIYEIIHPLSFVRRRMNDKMSWIINFLQSVLQPNPASPISMEESTFFSKEQKETCKNILKKLMTIERKSMALDIEGSEKQDAEFIKETYKQWKETKSMIKEIAKILREGWEKESKKEDKNQHYLG